jgi:hypothetical protein
LIGRRSSVMMMMMEPLHRVLERAFVVTWMTTMLGRLWWRLLSRLLLLCVGVE